MEMNFKQLGPYEIGDKLGAGGMGTVFAATDSSTGEQVAVKVLAPALAMQQGFRERFEAEIESLKKLEHPNIVKLYGYGQKDSFLFYGMELVNGANLEEELSNGRRFEWREVTQIGIKLARALKLAHDHGVIHRDIKPANVLMGEDGEIKLSDFGVARLFGNTGLTSEGGVLGTAEYMSPEQADGGKVTHRCDLYSLGGVLFALLAGRPPFRSKSMLELLQLQRFATPDSVRRYAPETPRELEKIVAQLLAKQPDDRFPNALMLARRLEAMEKGMSLEVAADGKSADKPGVTLLDGSSGTNRNERKSQESPPNQEASGAHLRETMDRSLDADSSAGEDSQAAKLRVSSGTDHDVSNSTDDIAFNDEGDLREADHFTTIEEERVRELISQRESVPLISMPTVFLVLSLLGTGVLIWYWAKPPSENVLLEKIESVARVGDEVRLREVEDEIGMFLRLYGDSDQAARVVEYQDRLDDARLSGRALRQANDLFRRYPDSIVAGDYVEAIRMAPSQPEKSLATLRAIVDLYSGQSRRRPEIRNFVNAANRQLPRLRRRVETRREQFRLLIERQLEQAQRLDKSNTKRANEIRQAVIELYASQSWADDLVARARQGIEAIGVADPAGKATGPAGEPPVAPAGNPDAAAND